jgi:hypothetical protein
VQNDQNDWKHKVIYTCVMHPEVKMNRPGNCPNCGMKLIKRTIKVSTPKSAPQMYNNMEMQKDTLPNKQEKKDMDMKMDMSGNKKKEMDELFSLILQATGGFFAFSFAASSGYVLNDFRFKCRQISPKKTIQAFCFGKVIDIVRCFFGLYFPGGRIIYCRSI